MASHHDDDIHETTPGYTLSQPKQSLAAYQQMVQKQQKHQKHQKQQEQQEQQVRRRKRGAPSQTAAPPTRLSTSTAPRCPYVQMPRCPDLLQIILNSLPAPSLSIFASSSLCFPPAHRRGQRPPALLALLLSFASSPHILSLPNPPLLFASFPPVRPTPILLHASIMSSAMVRSRSVSISVPAPPPPSPHHYNTLAGRSATVVTAADVEELLRLLCSKTNTPLPPLVFSASPAAPVVASVSTTVCATASVAVPLLRPSTSTLDSLDACNAHRSAAPSPHEAATEAITDQQKNETDTMLTMPGHGGTEDDRDQSGTASSDTSPTTSDSVSPQPSSSLDTRIDAGDESLQRYKESLGLGGGGKDLSDPSDPRVCIIKSLTLESPGRDPVTIDLSVPGAEATLKDKPFTVKEGSRFTMVATFKVQHEVLSGLRYVQIVKRKGIRVSKDSEMIGSYAPSTDKQPLYTKRFQEDEAPSGMLTRGHYVAQSSFVDDDKKTHLAFEWSFDIAKDW